MTMSDQYIFSFSKDIEASLPVAEPNPNNRYSVWVFMVVNRTAEEINLDYLENICTNLFVEYKVFVNHGSVTYDNAQGELVTQKTESFLIAATTKIRKRYSTLVNELDDYCDDSFRSSCIVQIARSTVSFLRFKPSGANIKIISSSKEESEYRGNDIQTLNDYNNFHSWQRSLYNVIWEEKSQTFKTPDFRSIYWIWDPEGNTGKSLFVKWMCVNKPEHIVKVSFGTPNQLRSSLISVGTKICYFIDVPRPTNNEDKIENLLSVIEDLKNGYLTSNFYGKYGSLIMEPPHVIVFSNKKCPRSELSEDRWRSYKINKKTLKLVKVK